MTSARQIEHKSALQAIEGQKNPVLVGVELAIHERRLPPGTRLAESDLAEFYGVSRSIVRTALQGLAHAQLVTIRANKGASVAQPSKKEAREVFEARELLEPRMAREAARRATAADVALLRRHLADEHAALEAGDPGRSLRLSGMFHIELARIAAHQTIGQFVAELVTRSALIIALYWRREGARCERHSHGELIDAIEAGDGQKAEDIMCSHLVDLHTALDLRDPEPEKRSLREMLSV